MPLLNASSCTQPDSQKIFKYISPLCKAIRKGRAATADRLLP